jgi:hypothetical protein
MNMMFSFVVTHLERFGVPPRLTNPLMNRSAAIDHIRDLRLPFPPFSCRFPRRKPIDWPPYLRVNEMGSVDRRRLAANVI